ncbi:MAG: T9SS type A sorting domain-containing protein [Chryseobacterium jejuense]|uniref:T9SS type A sorting domain-containing protein n=1 Tax=Chryseobacterium jejuense TaxID=445960 RepID=UPI003D1449B0
MKKKSTLKIFAAVLCIASSHTWARAASVPKPIETSIGFKHMTALPPSVYDLDPLIIISQNVNEKGLVVMKGNFQKPATAGDVKVTIKYKDAQNNWVSLWCKTFAGNYDYNEELTANFELPQSVLSAHSVKIELSSNETVTNWSSVTWNKTVNHYKQSDYTYGNCDLDENQYTILFTPKKNGTVVYNPNGTVSGVKDRVTSQHLVRKLDDIVLSFQGNAALDNSNASSPVVNITNPNNLSTIASSQKYIYQNSDTTPFEFSYHDPVYMFAGKFSNESFFINFSNWFLPPEEGGEPWGRGYLDFTNPNALVNRYYNLYNYINEKLGDVFTNQQPVVIVISKVTGLRVYKANGQYIALSAISNYNTTNDFGYPPLNNKQRGPGSENFSLSNTSQASLYGVGAIRNRKVLNNWNGPSRPLMDIESEINKFIKYVGIFTNPVTEECPVACFTINSGAVSDYGDWSKAPNSYIFTGKDKKTNAEVDGLYIPVKKAYKMWNSNPLMGGSPIPAGAVTADVYWEDIHGLIKSGENYSLEIISSGEEAKIKVPINKTKEGNAVIAYKVNGEIFWSWHVWVTDDPTNGSTYKSFDGVKRQKTDGTVELIPDSDWGWMDRNLGALSNTITGTEFNKNGGLLYQWGRKDPIPPLVYKGNDFYEASGSVGRIRHRQSRNMANGSQKIENLIKTVILSNATVPNNLRLSIKNPLSLIYVNKEDNSGQALYNNNANLQVNWFGSSATLPVNRLSELNLWSDNSKGFITNRDLSNDNSANPYRDKSSFDPCPNGWRIPSVLVANLGDTSYIDNVRVDFSPFGIKNNISINTFEANKYHIIKPNDNNAPSYMKGFKIYNNVGVDLSNVGGNNMGIFPGTGMLVRNYHEGQYTDQHETYLWTATMTRFFDATPSISARSFRMIPDRDQPDVPDPSLPSITGRYQYYPLIGGVTSAAHGCRCIKDPLYEVNNYNFPTEYFNNTVEYAEGLNNPNSYTIMKNTTETTIQIPISKAFSAQSKLLNNPDILNPSNFNNLKANVLWSTATGLISNIALSNAAPTSLADISNTNINVKIAPNQSGNAVVTLHNGSIINPIYWSWHIWVTNTPISSVSYVTELPNQAAVNYINYIKPGEVIKTEIMDRDLGANQAIAEANKTTSTGGLHFQWGRKDPLPVFVNANRNSVPVYLGMVQANGSVTYTTLAAATYYSDSYLKKYPDYSVQANVLATDKVADKISKVLSYSVKNPMIFMVPNMTTKSADTNHTNGADWLANEPNLAPERWGRGGKKSPFDPCPEGWRIPDLTGVSNTSIGATPFYKPTTGVSIPNNYGGTRINRTPSSSVAVGYSFDNPAYNIGSFANLGVRGGRSTIDASPAVPDYNFIDYTFGGFWLGALGSNYTGRALRTEIQYAGNYLTPFSSNSDPYFAQNCRCVKVQYDENGNELGPIPKLQITSLSAARATNVLAKSVIEDKITQNKLELFPNPVKSILYIKGNDRVKEYYYQIYNMSGQMVKSGKFENEQTDLSSLLSGAYLVRINNSETIVKIIKE